MENSNDVLQRFGGRKFVLALILVIAIVALAALTPASLTTEVIVGLLGVLATFSGSNAFLSRLATKQTTPVIAEQESITQEDTTAQESNVTQNEQPEIQIPVMGLEERVTQLETSQLQVIEIIKQQQSAIFTLTNK